MSDLPPYDPYAAKPTFFDKNPGLVWASAVFVLTAVLTVMMFPPYTTQEFAYAFAGPALFWAYERPRFKPYALTLFAAQAVAWTILLGWLHHVTWLGLLLLGPFMGAWTGLWYLGAWWVLPRMRGRQPLLRLLAMLGLGGWWVLIEWSRTWFLGGFPWLPLAASQWQRSAVLQIAAWTGAWGVSFILIVFNLGFAAYFHRALRDGLPSLRRRPPEFLLALLILMFATILPLSDTFHREMYVQPLASVAMVQPDIPQTIKWDPASAPAILGILEKTTLEVATSYPDVILWPEATTPWAVHGDGQMQAWAESLVRRARVPLVLGSIAIEHAGLPGEAWYNAACVVDPAAGLQPVYYAKRKLVPFGEYVPLRPLLGWLKKSCPSATTMIHAASGAAQPLTVSLEHRVLTLGPLICYEDVFPNLARDNALAGVGRAGGADQQRDGLARVGRPTSTRRIRSCARWKGTRRRQSCAAVQRRLELAGSTSLAAFARC